MFLGPTFCFPSPSISCRLWTSIRAWALILIVSVVPAGAQTSVTACESACTSTDNRCSRLHGDQYKQCVKQCQASCVPRKTPPPLLDPGCGNQKITGKIKCTIVQPPVGAHETPVPSVLFAAGDIVDVAADGCVQTGGAGNTWKRYVNPSGPNSNTMYHGLIRIPTGTPNSALVEIRTVMSQRLLVTGSASLPASQMMLSLGYQDDDYSDNGYDGHDDGTEDQCKIGTGIDGGPAHVTLTIYRGVKPDPPQSGFDFEVMSSKVDPNGLPYNPIWNWQIKPGNQNKIPDTSMCHNFSVREWSTIPPNPDAILSPYFADCTDQADESTVDQPTGVNQAICDTYSFPFFGSTFPGHVNWFPVTLEGQGGWITSSDDDDYTFAYTTEDGSCPLCVNGRDFIHVEFDSDETVDHFSSNEWNQLHSAVDNWPTLRDELYYCTTDQPCSPSDTATLKQQVEDLPHLFQGYAILTGMFGLDGEHGLKSELHPLFAVALRRDKVENSQDDEAWLMFVRNQGDEGFCSSHIWSLGLEDYTFRLPWRPPMIAVDVNWNKTQFVGTDGTSSPVVRAIPPPSRFAGVYVTFHLGPAQSKEGTAASVPFIEGALHLVWTGVSGTEPAPPAQPSVTRTSTKGESSAEEAVGSAIQKLSVPQQNQVRQARFVSAAQVPVHPLAPTGKVEIISQPPSNAPKKQHAVNVGPATQKLARDAAQIKALCAASNNAPTGLPAGTCKAAPPTTTTRESASAPPK